MNLEFDAKIIHINACQKKNREKKKKPYNKLIEG